MWDIIRERQSLLFFIGRLFSNFGDGLKFIAITWFTFAQTHSVQMVGGVLSITIVPGIIFTPIIGVLVDRFDRRVFATVVEVLQCIILLVWVYLLHTSEFNAKLLYLFTMLLAIGQSATRPALFSLLPELFSKDRILKLNSILSIASQGGYLMGSSLGGFIIAYIHPDGGLFVNALTYLISGLTLFNLRKGVVSPTSEKGSEPAPGIFASVIQMFTYMKHRGDIRVLVLMGVSTWLATMVINVLLAPFTSQVLKANSWAFGLLDAMIGIGAIVGSTLAPMLARRYKKRIIAVGFLLIGILLFLFGTNSVLLIALVLNLILGSIIEGTSMFVDTYIQLRVDNELLGRTSSTIRLGASIFGPLFMYASAAVAEHGSYLLAFGGLAAYMEVVGLLTFSWGARYEFDRTFELYSGESSSITE